MPLWSIFTSPKRDLSNLFFYGKFVSFFFSNKCNNIKSIKNHLKLNPFK